MTVEEVRIAALAECAEFGNNFPATESVCYRRASVRQQQLFELDAHEPYWLDFFGACAVGDVVEGKVNLRELIAGTVTVSEGEVAPAPAQRVHRVEIHDPGSSAYLVGQEVHVVPLTEIEDEAVFPPRVFFRDGVLRQVGTDLAGVGRVEVFYARRPREMKGEDDLVELPEPFGELLVFDLSKLLIRRARSIDKELREHALAVFDGLEAEMLAQFRAHVAGFLPLKSRG